MRLWVKNAVMLTVLAVWASVMVDWVFVQHIKPDAPAWLVPGAAYAAIYHGMPTTRPRRKR